MRTFLQMIASDTFTMCLLAAVAAAAVLAYGFGAEGELIVMILVLGVVTAFAETTIRAHNNERGPE